MLRIRSGLVSTERPYLMLSACATTPGGSTLARIPKAVEHPVSPVPSLVAGKQNEMYWRDLSPHARELVLRMVLTQPPTYFRHVENEDPDSWQMSFVIDEDYGADGSGACCVFFFCVFFFSFFFSCCVVRGNAAERNMAGVFASRSVSAGVV